MIAQDSVQEPCSRGIVSHNCRLIRLTNHISSVFPANFFLAALPPAHFLDSWQAPFSVFKHAR
jgi:hypothetical protein